MKAIRDQISVPMNAMHYYDCESYSRGKEVINTNDGATAIVLGSKRTIPSHLMLFCQQD